MSLLNKVIIVANISHVMHANKSPKYYFGVVANKSFFYYLQKIKKNCRHK